MPMSDYSLHPHGRQEGRESGDEESGLWSQTAGLEFLVRLLARWVMWAASNANRSSVPLSLKCWLA